LIEFLPHVNVTLNAIAAALLIIGLVLIKRGHETIHKRVMISAFCVSVLFLTSYLIYHYEVGDKKFPKADYPPVYSITYYAILATHIPLAIATPFLAGRSIYLGLMDRRKAHRKLVRWTFPIWMYVSLTGILIYFMLYWWFPPLGNLEARIHVGFYG